MYKLFSFFLVLMLKHTYFHSRIFFILNNLNKSVINLKIKPISEGHKVYYLAWAPWYLGHYHPSSLHFTITKFKLTRQADWEIVFLISISNRICIDLSVIDSVVALGIRKCCARALVKYAGDMWSNLLYIDDNALET
jgi:hypothetical protein